MNRAGDRFGAGGGDRFPGRGAGSGKRPPFPGRRLEPPPEPWVSGRELDRSRGRERRSDRDRDAEGLGGVLSSYLARSSLGERLVPASERFLAAWRRAAGDLLADRAVPRRLAGNVLHLEVRDPSWRFELRWRGKELAARLREEGIEVDDVVAD